MSEEKDEKDENPVKDSIEELEDFYQRKIDEQEALRKLLEALDEKQIVKQKTDSEKK